MSPYRTDRDSSRLAEGVDPEVPKRIRRRRSDYRALDTDERVVTLTDPENLRAMVERLDAEDALDSFIESLERLKGTDPKAADRLEKIKELIEKKRKGAESKRDPKDLAIEIERIALTVNTDARNIEKAFENLDKLIADSARHTEDVKQVVVDIADFIEDYENGIRRINELQEEYKEVTGSLFPTRIEPINLPNDKVKDIYRRLMSLSGQPGYSDIAPSIEYLRDTILPSLLDRPSDFDDIKREVEEEFRKGNVDELLAEYKEKLKVEYKKKFEATARCLSALEKPGKLDRDMLSLARDYLEKLKGLGINDPDASKYILRVGKEVEKDFNAELSNADMKAFSFVETKLIDSLSELRVNVDTLRSYNTIDSKFETLYTTILKQVSKIKEIIDKDEFKGYGVKIEFEPSTETLSVDFNCKYLSNYKARVMSKEMMEKYHPAAPVPDTPAPDKPTPPTPPAPDKPAPDKPTPPTPPAPDKPAPDKPTPPTPPTPPVPSDPGAKADVEVYLEKVDILNDLINQLNEINKKIVALAAHDYLAYPADRTLVDDGIELEKRAKNLDLLIMSNKTELSNLRVEYTNKYKASIFNVPEVRDKKIDSIEFESDYKKFIEIHDGFIVEAEEKIIEIDGQRKADPSRADEYTRQINELLSFIESQNSAIGRCLVAERQKSKIDIVAVLEERREAKKELREKLKEILAGKSRVPVTPTHPEPDKPAPDKPTPPEPDKPAPEKPTPPEPDKPAPEKPTPPEPDKPAPEKPTPPEPDKPVPGPKEDDEYKIIEEIKAKIAELSSKITEAQIASATFEADINAKIDEIRKQYPSAEINFNLKENQVEINVNHIIEVVGILNVAQYEYYINTHKDIQIAIIEKVGLAIIEAKSKELTSEASYRTIRSVIEKFPGMDKTLANTILNILVAHNLIPRVDCVTDEFKMNRKQFIEYVENMRSVENPQEAKQHTTSIVSISKGLKFNPKRKNIPQKVNSEISTVLKDANSLRVAIIENGVRIMYNKQLAEKLKEYSAKLRLVNKQTKRATATVDVVVPETEEQIQELEYSNRRGDRTVDDFRLEIRDGESKVLYEYDLANIPTEEVGGRKL